MSTFTTETPPPIDVTTEARRLRWDARVIIEPDVWSECVWWDEQIEARKYGVTTQETLGRLRDLLWQAYVALLASPSPRCAYFTIRVIPASGVNGRTVAMPLRARTERGNTLIGF